MNRLYSPVTVALLAAALAFAQPGPRGMRPGGPGGPIGFGGPGDFALLKGEFGFAGKVVTGSPYSAQAVTQFTQTLADGNHIQRNTTASITRDSEGRIRIEQTLAAIGNLSASGGGSRTIVFIHDTVAGMSYALDPTRHTAREMPISARGPANPAQAEARRGPNSIARRETQASLKTDDLGTQILQSVSAQGKRITRTIPAGQAGNERPLEIVTETWYSPELQVMVMSKTSDPRFGETVYQLNNISRAEPDRSLFTVPPDYTVEQGRPFRDPARAQ